MSQSYQKKIEKYFKLSDNENLTFLNVQVIAKEVLRENEIALNDYSRQEKRVETNYFSFHLKKLGGKKSKLYQK